MRFSLDTEISEYYLFAVLASRFISHQEVCLAPLDVRSHFSDERDGRFLDNNSIMLELRALMRIIGILTYRMVENRYVPLDKGLRMDTQERRETVSPNVIKRDCLPCRCQLTREI